jgi:transposase InsO family protein
LAEPSATSAKPAGNCGLVVSIITTSRLHWRRMNLFLHLNGIEHTRIKVRHPQTNGAVERLNQTVQDEFSLVAFRKRSIVPSKRFRPISMNICTITIPKEPIRAGIVMGALRCRHSSMVWNFIRSTFMKILWKKRR